MICARRAWSLFAALALVATLVVGCASTRDRFDQARAFEAERDYAGAAEKYIEVLERDLDWAEARDGLETVGPRAITSLLEEAAAAEEKGSFEEGLQAMDRAAELHAGAGEVGVSLALPDDFASSRRDLVDRLVEALTEEAELSAESGSWRAALGAYDRALDYVDPGSSRGRGLVHRQAELHVLWGEDLVEAGQPRAGFDRAAQAIALVGPSDPMATRVGALQSRALTLGTRLVAFVPLSRHKAVDLDAPSAFAEDLNEILALEAWADPPPFIAPTDPVALRRELRRSGYEDRILTTREAAEIGRSVDSNYVVVGEIVTFRVQEKDAKDEVKRARLRADRSRGRSRDTNYVEHERTVRYDAEVAYRIVDARTRRTVRDRTISGDESRRVRTASFTGDYQDLELSGSELERFNGESERADLEDLANELADKLASQLATRVYQDLLAGIP